MSGDRKRATLTSSSEEDLANLLLLEDGSASASAEDNFVVTVRRLDRENIEELLDYVPKCLQER